MKKNGTIYATHTENIKERLKKVQAQAQKKQKNIYMQIFWIFWTQHLNRESKYNIFNNIISLYLFVMYIFSFIKHNIVKFY